MLLLKIAFRNILRNGRRTGMTAAAIAIGALALILFGEYRGMAEIGMETGTVQGSGHLTLFRKGYTDFGSGKPAAYSISGYHDIIRLIASDPELKPMLAVVTPTVSLGGIAGNAATDRSKTFFALGVVPSDRDRMRRWDEYGLHAGERYAPYPLSDAVSDRGIVGKGLARILGLCTPDGDCRPAPRLDLLSGSSGAPNVVSMVVNRAQSQGPREIDDSYVGMHIALAQQLLYGRGERMANSIVIQLRRTEDLAQARGRLERLIAEHGLDLEVRDFRELSPFLNQVLTMLRTLFAFVSTILAIIVLFTIANTMGMSVMERVNEVGTARAMGVRRSGIRRQFLIEGAMVGAAGASAGVVLAIATTVAINHAGITYHMPVSASPIPLYLMDENVSGLRAGVWLALVAIAVAASIIPANRAAGMKVIDALRHV
jgi:putative ABC transport system permease protein